MAILNLKRCTAIQKRSYEACCVTERNWYMISPTSDDACHRPVAMQVQTSATNTVRSYVSCLVSDIEKPSVRSLFFVRAEIHQNIGSIVIHVFSTRVHCYRKFAIKHKPRLPGNHMSYKISTLGRDLQLSGREITCLEQCNHFIKYIG